VRIFAISEERAALLMDPVCRMRLSDGESAGRLDHRGRSYDFCSPECIEAFGSNPDAYTA
jgi:YHS domain-containing protein